MFLTYWWKGGKNLNVDDSGWGYLILGLTEWLCCITLLFTWISHHDPPLVSTCWYNFLPPQFSVLCVLGPASFVGSASFYPCRPFINNWKLPMSLIILIWSNRVIIGIHLKPLMWKYPENFIRNWCVIFQCISVLEEGVKKQKNSSWSVCGELRVRHLCVMSWGFNYDNQHMSLVKCRPNSSPTL